MLFRVGVLKTKVIKLQNLKIKKLLLQTIAVILFYSCQPRIKNNTETLEKVFNMTSFQIEIKNWGCFHNSEEHFIVTLKSDEYLLKSKKTGESHMVSKVNMDSLKNYLKAKIGKEDYGGCSSSEYIRIGSLFNSIDYEHSHCSGIEATIINDLLNYSELTIQNRIDE
ncbi:conserved hypothetical protein [Tenacibaculum sp. 190130A14a]|uniref:Lipoprotein n=1 Tax=Tenacibaculum polynesiense TaxID=3137857 RepID=A0ABM9PE08_9FLAO